MFKGVALLSKMLRAYTPEGCGSPPRSPRVSPVVHYGRSGGAVVHQSHREAHRRGSDGRGDLRVAAPAVANRQKPQALQLARRLQI
jgi:hypothetical protein